MKRMRRSAAILCCAIVGFALLTGCGKAVDDQGNTLITSRWKPVEFTVNGTTTEHEPLFIWEIFSFPRFKCDDGTHFTLLINGETREGTVTPEDDGTYTIVFDNNDNAFQGVIEDDVLTITSSDNNVSLVFKTS